MNLHEEDGMGFAGLVSDPIELQEDREIERLRTENKKLRTKVEIYNINTERLFGLLGYISKWINPIALLAYNEWCEEVGRINASIAALGEKEGK